VGCIGENGPEKNSTVPQIGNNNSESVKPVDFPSLYHDPIGGFEQTETVLEPNTVFETNYIFYSQDWGPGEVNYTLSTWYMNESFDIVNRTYLCCSFPLKNAKVTIEPSLIVEPNRSYRSRVSFNSTSVPDEFFTGISDGAGTVYHPIRLNITVLAGNKTSPLADDQIYFLSSYRGARPVGDRLSPSDRSFQIRRGERKEFSFTFETDYNVEIGQMSCVPSPTQLNVTISPSSFIEKHFEKFPLTVSIAADQNLTPGFYPFSLNMNRITSPAGIQDFYGRTYGLSQNAQTQSSFAINVTVVE